MKYTPTDRSGEYEFDLFGKVDSTGDKAKIADSKQEIPKYVNEIQEALETVLNRTQLSLWLMIDRLDEIFPRRSQLETRALRGLLRAMRYFGSSTIRVKVFLRDDMLGQVVATKNGFTALTHLTAGNLTLCVGPKTRFFQW